MLSDRGKKLCPNKCNKDRFNCENRKKLPDKCLAVRWEDYPDDDPEKFEEKKEIKKIIKEADQIKVDALGDLRMYQCAESYIKVASSMMIRRCRQAKKFKTAYRAGGIVDQPEWFLDAMEIYEAELARHQTETAPLVE